MVGARVSKTRQVVLLRYNSPMTCMYSLMSGAIALTREAFCTLKVIRNLARRDRSQVIGVYGIVPADGRSVFGSHVIVYELSSHFERSAS